PDAAGAGIVLEGMGGHGARGVSRVGRAASRSGTGLRPCPYGAGRPDGAAAHPSGRSGVVGAGPRLSGAARPGHLRARRARNFAQLSPYPVASNGKGHSPYKEIIIDDFFVASWKSIVEAVSSRNVE